MKYVKKFWNSIKISNKNSITVIKNFGRKLRFLTHSGGTNFPENIFWHICTQSGWKFKKFDRNYVENDQWIANNQ